MSIDIDIYIYVYIYILRSVLDPIAKESKGRKDCKKREASPGPGGTEGKGGGGVATQSPEPNPKKHPVFLRLWGVSGDPWAVPRTPG